MYVESGEFQFDINPNEETDVTGRYSKIMTFGWKAFESNFSLGRSIIHETGHAFDITTGDIAEFDKIGNKNLRKTAIEYQMYEYELTYALP